MIPTLVVIAYIDNIYTVGKVISSFKKQKFFEHFLGKCEKNTKLQKFKKDFYIFDSKYINAY